MSPEKVFEAFYPDAGVLQKKIFLSWLKGLQRECEEIGVDTTQPLRGEEFPFIIEKTIRYLNPKYWLMRSPFYLPDMEKAVSILRMAHERREAVRIGIYSDRDTDGITAGSMLALFLRDKMGIAPENILYLTPEEEDKYGFVEDAADRFLPFEPDIMILLDLGSSNANEILEYRYAADKNPAFIIIDHHTIPESEAEYPQVEAFINPKRFSVESPERNLCSAAIAFKLIHAVFYSYTKEYNKTYHIGDRNGQEQFLKNGVIQSQGEKNHPVYFSDLHGKTSAFDSAWNTLLQRDKQVYDFSAKMKRAGINIPPAWRINILTNYHFRKIREKLGVWSTLAATGTIADLQPLLDDNRILVLEGLNRLKNGGNHFPAGVKEVFKVCGVFGKTVTAEDLSFSVGPLINAAGRLGKSSLAAETFLEADPLKAAEKAAQLKKLNEQRRTLSREALDLLSEEKNIFLSEKLVVAYDEKIHRGISGLVAGKLAEKYKKAALVLVHDGECLRGSIRSYDNEDVFSLLKDHEDFFIQYGGHRQAAGFSLAYEKREEFIQTILQASSQLVCEVNSDDKNYLMEIQDFELQRQIWEEPQIFEPYGKGNPYPALLLKPTQEVIPEPLGKTGEHSKIRFSGINDPLIEAVWFFRKPEEVPTEKKLLFQPQKNYFGGSLKFQMKILSSHEE